MGKRLLAIVTGFDPKYCALDELWKELVKNGFDCLVIAPRFMHETKGGIENPIQENRDGVEVRRIYDTVKDMWLKPYFKKDEIIDLTKKFQPDIIFCHHIANQHIAFIVKSVFDVPLVMAIEVPELYSNYKNIEKRLRYNTQLVIAWSKLKGKIEVERTRPGEQYYINIPIIVPVSEKIKIYKPEEKINRGIFCGTLQWAYKRSEEFIELLPQLFEQTPMQEFLLISNPCPQIDYILNNYGDKYNIKHIERMPRFELLNEISRSYFGFSCVYIQKGKIGYDIDGFCSECKALSTPLFHPYCYDIEDGSFLVKSLKNLQRLYEDKDFYIKICEKARKNYYETTSPQNVVPKYVKVLNALLDGNIHEVWEELRYKEDSSEKDRTHSIFVKIKEKITVLLSNPPGNNLKNNFPFLMAYTTSFLRKNKINAFMVDSMLNKEDFNSYISRIRDSKFDWVIIDTHNHDINHILCITERISKYSRIALCGNTATIMAQELIKQDSINAILKGEYEKISLKLIQTQEDGIYDYDLIDDLDILPFPYRDYSSYYYYYYLDSLENENIFPQLHILGSRGCLFKCNLCEKESVINLNKYRVRKNSRILEEIKTVLEIFPRYKSLFFYDIIFNINNERILDICKKLKEINIPWFANCILSIIDINTLRVMWESGCNGLICHVNNEIEILKNNFNKEIDFKVLEEKVKEIKRIGIKVYLK